MTESAPDPAEGGRPDAAGADAAGADAAGADAAGVDDAARADDTPGVHDTAGADGTDAVDTIADDTIADDTIADDTEPDGAAVRRAAVRSSLAVVLAVSAYGVSFGALAVTAGFDVWQTCVLSLLMFSGGSQFALIGVVASGGTAAGPAAIAGAALLGLRNTLYAIRMSAIIPSPWWRRVAAGHLTIDESTAVATAQPTLAAQRTGFWWTGVGIFLGWNLTTLVGALVGDLLGDVSRWGLDAAAGAAFLGLLWPRLRALQPIVVAVGAALVAIVCIPALPTGVPVLAATLVALVVGVGDLFARRRA